MLFSWLILLNIAIVVLIWMTLRYFLPARIKQAVAANGTRLDGTKSRKRTTIEKRELRSVIGTAVAFSLPILFLMNLLLLFTHYRIAPLSLATEAFQNFSWDDREWQQRLDGGETQNLSSRFEGWKEENGIAGTKSLMQLVAGWPVALTVLGILAMGMFAVCGGIYLAGLKRLMPRIKQRHQEYLAYDMRGRHEQVELSSRQRDSKSARKASMASSR